MAKQNTYDWKFCIIGGVTRVIINSGEDIAHLGELDQKLWSVLSCPVKGLEFDEQTLQILDTDNDGKIRVKEIVDAANWLTAVIRNNDDLLLGADSVAINQLDDNNVEGVKIIDAMRRLIDKIKDKSDKDTLSLADVAVLKADFSARVKAKDDATAAKVAVNRPYGDNTDDVMAACTALKDKVADYFMRCKLIAFNGACADALDVSVEKIQSIADGNIAAQADRIASYPLQRPAADGLLRLNVGVNPVWQATFDKVRSLALAVDYPESDTINEAQWNAVLDKLNAYVACKESEHSANVELFDKSMTEEDGDLKLLDKLLHLYRDFFALLKNYVVLSDFYSRDSNKLAVFQAGKLYIDQRCCELCIKVTDMAQQTTMAPLSGMYLIYCKCTSKAKNATMDIVAALTDGDVDDLRVGKNAIFYDRSGQDWDATVTKIIDNPISIRQAFWSPYKKLWNYITEKINKSAADKEKASMDKLTAKTDTAMTDVQTKLATSQEEAASQPTPTAPADGKKNAFDIAKFAGIFAAIGMAVGFIGSALVSLGGAITAKWYNLPLLIVGLMVTISGPSVFIAWTKLRKRNIGPILNANGWAVNAQARINTRFGSTLTSLAKYPRVAMLDPYADEKTPWWKKVLTGALVCIIVFAVLFFVYRKKVSEAPEPAETVVAEQVEAPANTGTDAAAVDKTTPAAVAE